MQTRSIALLLGAVLTAGTCLAQQADPNQTAPQAPAATAQQSAPQSGPRHAMDPNRQAKHLAKQLGLNHDQVQQIRPILADRQQQFQTLQADTSLTQKDRRSRMRTIQQDSKAKIEAVLNDTQKQQFEQMLVDRRAHRHNQQQAPQSQQPGL